MLHPRPCHLVLLREIVANLRHMHEAHLEVHLWHIKYYPPTNNLNGKELFQNSMNLSSLTYMYAWAQLVVNVDAILFLFISF